jgi:prolyl-tRNA synthetase
MRRDEGEKIELALDESLASNVIDLLEKSGENLSKIAWDFQAEHVKFTEDVNEISELVEAGNVVKFYWSGDEAVGKEIEEKTGYDILGIHEEVSEGKCIASGEDAKYIALIAKTY